MCKEYKSDLLISGEIERRISWPESIERDFVGAVSLRGKGSPVDLFNVQPRSA
jgi:hypothetical protein